MQKYYKDYILWKIVEALLYADLLDFLHTEM